MNNKIFLIFSVMLLFLNKSQASFLWNIQDGIALYQKNDIKNATDFFKIYEKYHPNDKQTYFWLAKTYLKSKDNNEKENLSQNALKKFYELYSQEKNIEKISYEPVNNQKIEDYFDMAIMYFEEGNFFEANYYADLILRINPKSSSAYFIKAKLAQLEKKEEIAKEFLNQAIALNNDILRTNLAKSLNIYSLPELTQEMYLTFAHEAYFYLDMENAIKNAKKYLELDKSNFNVYSLLVEAYIAMGNVYNAKMILDEALKFFPNNVQLKLLQSTIADIENNMDDKENALKTAFEINPNNKQVLFELCNYYIQKEEYSLANDYAKTLIVIDDSMYEAYFNYVYSLIKLGDIDSATIYIRKLSELNVNKSELNYLLSLICQYQGDFENSKQYLLQAIKEDENPNYYLELGKLEYLNKNYYKSEKYLLEGLKNASDVKTRNEIEEFLIKNYLKSKNLKLAQNYILKKNSLDKNRIIYKYNLYVLYKLKGNYKNNLKQFIKTRPSTDIDILDLSEVYFEEGNFKEAIKLLDKAIKKTTQKAQFYLQKIKFYYMQNNENGIKETINEMKNDLNCPQG